MRSEPLITSLGLKNAAHIGADSKFISRKTLKDLVVENRALPMWEIDRRFKSMVLLPSWGAIDIDI